MVLMTSGLIQCRQEMSKTRIESRNEKNRTELRMLSHCTIIDGPYIASEQASRQRAYRERKLHHIYELEDTIKRLENKITTLQTENRDLNVDINRTRSENAVLRVAVFENRTLRSDEFNIPAIPDRTGPKTGVLLSDLLLMSDRQTVFEKRRQIGI